MKLELNSISNDDSVINHIASFEYDDKIIAELVTFWTNVRYTSPQFALDLSHDLTSAQIAETHYDLPLIAANEKVNFTVTTDSILITDLQIVQLELNFIDSMSNSLSITDWEVFFDHTDQWIVIPDGSAYIQPVSAETANNVMLEVKPGIEESLSSKYFSFKALVSFTINSQRYFCIFDPVVRITNNTTPTTRN